MNSLKPGKVYYSRRQRPLSLLHRYSRRRNKRALEIVGQWWNKKKKEKRKERKGREKNKERKEYIRGSGGFIFAGFIHRSDSFHPSHASARTNSPTLISTKWENFTELVTVHRPLSRSLYIYAVGAFTNCVWERTSHACFFFSSLLFFKRRDDAYGIHPWSAVKYV